MTKEEIKEISVDDILTMNYRLLTLAGFGMAIMFEFHDLIPKNKLTDHQKKAYAWYKKAVTDLIYKEEPFTAEMP